ncbi:MAG: hypothetical protein U0798_11920 [Gemmataceae bacterium]
MSRAYRIQVKESERREIRASDEIGTRLELLDILPPQATAELLRGELKSRGFTEQEDGTLSRTTGETTVTVDPCNGDVTVRTENLKDVVIESQKDGHAIDDIKGSAQAVEKRLRDRARDDIDKQFEAESAKAQNTATEQLEKSLTDLQPELNSIVNKITREALKAKAAQMGRIQEIAEDSETGSMTIKIEV